MLYSWSWWWFMSWIVPMVLLTWVVFGWNPRRWAYRNDYAARRDESWNDYDRASSDVVTKHRGRGPRNYVRSDARIEEDLCDQLTLDGALDASAIEVDVERGVVQLHGRVETRYDKRRAESIADSVLGVKDVENKLEIGSLSSTAPAANTTPAHQS